MTITATPDVIARYLGLAAAGDLDAVIACFTDDAEVVDEDQTFRGHDEIRHWRETVTSKFTYTVDVMKSEALGADTFVVTAQLEGNFPGSPVQLRFRFVLRDGLIAALEIAP
jgi:ketosteroid isomerase-like protein